MSDKDLSKALLNLNASQTPAEADIRVQTGKILERDRFRVRILAGITIFFWLGAAIFLYWCAFTVVGLYFELQEGGNIQVEDLASNVYEFLLMLSACLEGVIWAILCTLLLLFASRRANLRQINANLIEISQQLRELQNSGNN